MCSAPDVAAPATRQDSRMPERSARGDAADPMKRKRGYSALLKAAAGGGDLAPAATTATAGASGKLGG